MTDVRHVFLLLQRRVILVDVYLTQMTIILISKHGVSFPNTRFRQRAFVQHVNELRFYNTTITA